MGMKNNPAPQAMPSGLTLEQVKDRKRGEMANARWQAETGGVVMNDEVIKTDRESQSMLAIAIQAEEPIPTWKINDTTFVALSVDELKELGKVIKAHVQLCFDREAELSKQITAVKTVEEVNAITWAD